MPTLVLDDADCNQLMTIIGGSRDFPWTVTNPLLMKIGQQLRSQREALDRFAAVNGPEQPSAEPPPVHPPPPARRGK